MAKEARFTFYTPCCTPKTTTAGILGNTIEEKTRAILGWTDCNGGLEDRSAPQRKGSRDGLGPDRVKKRKPSSGRPNGGYPYDLLTGTAAAGSRKSSSSSVNSLSSTTNELSSLLLTHELTPPPSPIFKNQANGVTVVTLPRPSLPQPPPYGKFQFHHQQPAPEMQLPISPVSPPAVPAVIVEDPLAKAGTFRLGASATEIFERLRTQMPQVSSEQSKFRILLQTVANVIELETKLAQLHEETRSLSNILEEKRRQQQMQQAKDGGSGYLGDCAHAKSPEERWADPSFAAVPTPLTTPSEDVPDDLQEIDVTAFRCLVSDKGPISDRPSSTQFWPYQSFAPAPSDMVSFGGDFGYITPSMGTLANPLVVDIMS